MTDLAIGIAVLATIAALFGLGWYLGRRTEIQRQVDAAFRRETRLRHPVRLAKDNTAGTRRYYADGRCTAAGCAYYRQHLADEDEPSPSTPSGVSPASLARMAPHLRARGLVSARTADLLTDGDPQVTASVDARLGGLSMREATAGAGALSAAVRDSGSPMHPNAPDAIRGLSDAARRSERLR